MAAEVPMASESVLVLDAASDLLSIAQSDNQTSPLPKEAPELPSLAKATPPPTPLIDLYRPPNEVETTSVKAVALTKVMTVAVPTKVDATADAEPTAPEKTSPKKNPIDVAPAPSGPSRSRLDDATDALRSLHFDSYYEDDSDETPLLEAKSDATASPVYNDAGSEWVVCQTEAGYAYYYNTRTHASQWEAPGTDDNGREAFFSAVTAGDVNAATRLLLRHGRQLLDVSDHNGRTAVWYALGHMSMAQLLFESGASLNLTDVDANGLVHVATRQRNVAFLALLAVYGANLDLVDGAQQTPLHIAAASGYQRCVDVLLRHGATPDVLDSAARSPLQLSTLGNHVACVQLLQKASAQQAPVADIALLTQRAALEREVAMAHVQLDELQERYTTLETAHRIANARIVMLEAVVDRCEKDLDAERALLWQKEQTFNDAQQTQYATLQDLQRQVDDVVQVAARSRLEVTAMAESHLPERENERSLYVDEGDATSLGPSDTIAFDHDEDDVKDDEAPIAPERVGAIWSAFFNNAAKARVQDDNPSKVLDAVYDGDLVTLQSLLVHGASPDPRNDDDQTPLHVASAYGRLECVSLLCEYMADMEARDAHGHTPLFLASRRGHLSIVKFLLESAADVRTANGDGRTLVHAAALSGSLPCLHLVLEYGGDPFAADRDGETPYEMLLERGDESAASLLDYLDSQCSLRQPPTSPRPTSPTAAAPGQRAATSSYDEDEGDEAPREGWRGWIRGKATSLLGLDRTAASEDDDQAAAEAPLSPLKPPTDAEVASSMAYRKLVPPRHVEEAMQHLQSTAQHAASAPSSKRGLPRDVANALERRSSTNQFALATDAKSLHQKQKSSARYVDIAFHP